MNSMATKLTLYIDGQMKYVHTKFDTFTFKTLIYQHTQIRLPNVLHTKENPCFGKHQSMLNVQEKVKWIMARIVFR